MQTIVVAGGEGVAVAVVVEGAEGEAEWTSIDYRMNLSFGVRSFLHRVCPYFHLVLDTSSYMSPFVTL